MKDEVEKLIREGFEGCGLEAGVLESMTAHYTKKLLALQVEAVRAELKELRKNYTAQKQYYKDPIKDIDDRLADLRSKDATKS